MTTDDESTDSAPSPRTAFTNRLRDYAEMHPELSAGEVARIVTGHLLDDDRAFVEDFFIHEGRLILTWDLRSNYVRDRRGIYRIVELSKTGEPEFEKMAARKMESVFDKISKWREFDPLSQQGKLFISFTKPMLTASAERDATDAVHFGWKADFKTKLAENLPDEMITVGEYFSPEEVLTIMSETKRDITKDIQNGKIRIKLKTVAIKSQFAQPVLQETI